MSESTVSRELRRNGRRNGGYNFMKAHEKAMRRRHREPGNRAKPPELIWRIRQLILDEQWSPGQISGYLLRKEGIRISHETIYKLIRADETGRLAANCRHRMKYRKSASHRHVTKATNIKNRVSIHQQPKEADGKRFGDWEMDLIVDREQNAILTMVERSTNFLLMAKLKQGKLAKPAAQTAWRLLLPYKGEKLHTITTDNGPEFAAHEWLTARLDVPVYFTDSYASWQKGAVENTNKLIRQYIPKGMDIGMLTERKIASIQAKINRRPRKKLNLSTPKDEFFKHYS